MNRPNINPDEGVIVPDQRHASVHWALSRPAIWLLRVIVAVLLGYRAYVVFFRDESWDLNAWAPVWVVAIGLYLLQDYALRRHRESTEA